MSHLFYSFIESKYFFCTAVDNDDLTVKYMRLNFRQGRDQSYGSFSSAS